jgi:hypothetical protein
MTLVGVWCGVLLVILLLLRELVRSRHTVVRPLGSAPDAEGDPPDPRWTPPFGAVVVLAIAVSVMLLPRLWGLLT